MEAKRPGESPNNVHCTPRDQLHVLNTRTDNSRECITTKSVVKVTVKPGKLVHTICEMDGSTQTRGVSQNSILCKCDTIDCNCRRCKKAWVKLCMPNCPIGKHRIDSMIQHKTYCLFLGEHICDCESCGKKPSSLPSHNGLGYICELIPSEQEKPSSLSSDNGSGDIRERIPSEHEEPRRRKKGFRSWLKKFSCVKRK